MMLGAFGTMFSGPGDASAAVANATVAGPNDLARLQELIKELEPAAPVAQPKLPELLSMPMVEQPPRVLETKPVPQEGFPNAEVEGNVMVFDEAEASVERALRRLAPSPGPKPAQAQAMNVAMTKTSRWCAKCDEFYNGAKDAPDASMCTKKAGKQRACYANNAGCPSDMKTYTCNPSVAGENGPSAGLCPATVVGAYNGLKTEVSALMTELLELKQTEQDLTLQLITNAEHHPTCACGPVDQLKSFML
jgi:hypothetical protein